MISANASSTWICCLSAARILVRVWLHECYALSSTSFEALAKFFSFMMLPLDDDDSGFGILLVT